MAYQSSPFFVLTYIFDYSFKALTFLKETKYEWNTIENYLKD